MYSALPLSRPGGAHHGLRRLPRQPSIPAGIRSALGIISALGWLAAVRWRLAVALGAGTWVSALGWLAAVGWRLAAAWAAGMISALGWLLPVAVSSRLAGSWRPAASGWRPAAGGARIPARIISAVSWRLAVAPAAGAISARLVRLRLAASSWRPAAAAGSARHRHPTNQFPPRLGQQRARRAWA